MTLCVKTGYQCNCQPNEGVFCPDYKPDAYVQYLMDAILELRAEIKAALAQGEGMVPTRISRAAYAWRDSGEKDLRDLCDYVLALSAAPHREKEKK